ncbi:alpha/beta fold hydrolase [Streptomyces sp. 7N604]|uniref:alpha/beta fold hydrolase n=1 Tax=Streptomyces sp. 7N604 TaxID=3457415 RepID=UPI003FD5F510
MTEWTRVAADDGLEVWRGPGDGPPLVAAHGIEDSWSRWRPLAEQLTGFTTYALQLPWHGGNTYTWRQHGTPGQWLRRALDLVPETPTVLLGHSFGANAALEHLATPGGPRRPAALVLAAPFYRPAGFPVTPGLRQRSLAAFRKVLNDGLRLSLGPRGVQLDPDIRTAMGRKLLDRAVPAGFPVFFDEFVASGRLNLARIPVPTLVLAGVDDESLTPMRAAELERAMPTATVRLRPSYGHFCHVEQAGRMSRDTGEFLHGVLNESSDLTEGEKVVAELLDGEPTSYVGMPRYEGVNIRTWVGFKHFMYLVEEAVLQYFRDRGVGARCLYHRFGLGLEIVDSSVQLPVALEADEQVYATVVSATPKPGKGAPFAVELVVERDGRTVTALKGKVRVALVTVKDGAGGEPVPAFLEPYVVSDVAALEQPGAVPLPVADGRDPADVLVPAGSGALLWSWRAPYYYCHFSDRLQHSAYVRTLEEVVDRFLHSRGLAVGKLLDERGWIPVVSRARVRLLADVFMEETVHTVFRVEEILKDTMYTARMDCYVRRGDGLERTATGTIMHGYAISRGERAGTVATLDEATQAALLGGGAA